jgi:hypothetical protein
VQPGRQGAPLADRFRQAGQAEKDGLKDVLGIVAVPDAAPGGPQDQRAVAGDQQGKRLAIRSRHEALQQHGVVRRRGLVAQPAKVALQRLHRLNEHAQTLTDRTGPCPICTRPGRRGSTSWPGCRLLSLDRMGSRPGPRSSLAFAPARLDSRRRRAFDTCPGRPAGGPPSAKGEANRAYLPTVPGRLDGPSPHVGLRPEDDRER